MIFAGVDPGASSGAIAFIDNDGVPILTRNFTDWKDIAGLLEPHRKGTHIIIGLEKVHGMPGMSVKAVSSFMSNYGGWLALLEVFEIPYISPPPFTWQRNILGTFPAKQSKPRAFAYAKQRWPTMNLKKSQEGVIDALCIAEYTRKGFIQRQPDLHPSL